MINQKKQCGHLRCGSTCRFGPKKKKFTPIKRTPIKKRFYRIPKVSKKREAANEKYFPEREVFLKQGDGLCELKVPGVCVNEKYPNQAASCVHHPEGRIGDNLLNFEKCMRSCHPCNNWVEANDAEARKMGLKRSRLGSSKKRPLRIT